MAGVAIAAAVGAVVGGAAAAIQSGGDFNAIWKGALIGGVAGGVGGWAAPALAPALGITSAAGVGALGGGIAGVVGGIGSVALNGGNGSDYLKAGLFGGIGGAATGGLMGSLGGEAANGINPVTGEAVPTGAPTTTPLPDGDVGTAYLGGGDTAATGFGGSDAGTQAVQNSVTGTSQSVPQATAPQLSETYNIAANAQSLDSGVMNPSSMTPGIEAPAGSFGTSFDTSVAPTKYDTFGIPTTSSGQYAFDDAVQGTMSGNAASAPKATTDYSSMTDQYGNKYSDLYGDKFQTAMEAGAAGKSYDPNNYIGNNAMTWGDKLKYNFGDFLSQTGKGVTSKMLNAGNLLKGVGAITGYGEANQNKQQLMDLYNQQNAYNQQLQGMNAQAFQQNLAANTANQQAFRDQLAAAQGYNTQLQNTYSNPEAYLNSPEAQATRSLAMQKLLAQQSAAGRRTSGLAAQNQLMANQLQNIQAYRQGLRQAIQYPNQVSGMGYQATTNPALALSAAQSQSPTGNLMAGLGSIFAPQPNYVVLR